jgi:hypothetical protein
VSEITNITVNLEDRLRDIRDTCKKFDSVMIMNNMKIKEFTEII